MSVNDFVLQTNFFIPLVEELRVKIGSKKRIRSFFSNNQKLITAFYFAIKDPVYHNGGLKPSMDDHRDESRNKI